MLQVKQPPSNLLQLQKAGEVHCGHHTSTTAGTLAALCLVPGTQSVCSLPSVARYSGTSPTGQHPRCSKSTHYALENSFHSSCSRLNVFTTHRLLKSIQ